MGRLSIVARNTEQPSNERESFIGGWKKHWRPRLAWLAIGAFVTLYDATCPKGETLSEECYRQRESKLGRFLIDKLMKDTVQHLQGQENWINKVAQLSPKQ